MCAIATSSCAAHPGTGQQQQHTSLCRQKRVCPTPTFQEDESLLQYLGFFLLFVSQEQNIATQTHSTLSRVFTCLDRIVQLIETSTRNEQPAYLEIWQKLATLQVYSSSNPQGSKSVSLASSKEHYLCQVRRKALVNLFWDSLITSGRRKGE